MTTNGQLPNAKRTEYDYGLAKHVRVDVPGKKKKMWWEPRLSQAGISIADLPLYNIEEAKILHEKYPDEWILWPEGEKCVAICEAMGYAAVTNGGGAGQRLFGDALLPLAGWKIALMPDQGKTGAGLADFLAPQLADLGCQIKRLELPGLDEGQDVADWAERFETGIDARKSLKALIEAAPAPKLPEPTIRLYTDTQLAEMELPPVTEVIPGLFGAGHYILSGAPKMGKSFLLMSMAFAISQGGAVLGEIKVNARDVLYLCLEDGLRRTVTRLKARADQFGTTGRLHFAFQWPTLEDGGLEHIRSWLFDHPSGVVFIDTGKRLRMGQEENGKSYYSSDYDFIAPITDLAHEFDALIITVWHDRKMMADDFFDQINASRGLTAAVDGLGQLSRERGSKEAKLSIGDRDSEDRAFKLRWDDILTGWLLEGQVDVAEGKGSPILRVMSSVRKLDSELGVSADMVQADLGDMAIGTIRNHITALLQQGAITRLGRGRVRAVPLTDSPDDLPS